MVWLPSLQILQNISTKICSFIQGSFPALSLLPVVPPALHFPKSSAKFTRLLAHICWMDMVKYGNYLLLWSEDFKKLVQAPPRRSIVFRENNNCNLWHLDRLYQGIIFCCSELTVIKECSESIYVEGFAEMICEEFVSLYISETQENIMAS